MAKTLENAVGMIKSIIGMCSDEKPHADISEKLWEVVEFLRRLKDYGK